MIRVDINHRPDQLCCIVEDNGVGRPSASAGRGRRLVQSIAADLDGVVEWAFSVTGSRATLLMSRMGC